MSQVCAPEVETAPRVGQCEASARCWPSTAAAETGAGLNHNGICGEGSQVIKGLLHGCAFRELQERGPNGTVSRVRDVVPLSLNGSLC